MTPTILTLSNGKGIDMSRHEFVTLREANRVRQREWDKEDKITIAYRANELAGEMGEACNVIKKLERERLGIRGSRATLDQLAEELADVVICDDLVAMSAGCDLVLDTGHPVGITKETCSLELVRNVGRLCEAVIIGHSVSGVCISVERSARAVAVFFGVDLNSAIRAKFNATSEKIGLKTRMIEGDEI